MQSYAKSIHKMLYSVVHTINSSKLNRLPTQYVLKAFDSLLPIKLGMLAQKDAFGMLDFRTSSSGTSLKPHALFA